MDYKEVIAALRSTPSRSKRELFDTAADMIERLTQISASEESKSGSNSQ